MQIRRSGKQVTQNQTITPKNVQEAITLFLRFKEASGSAERTVVDYGKHLKRFFVLYQSDTLNLETLEPVVLEDFAQYGSKAPSTYNLHYAYLHAFFNWCVEKHYLEDNPIKTMKLKKKATSPQAKNVPESIIMKLLDVIELDSYVGLRDYALVVLTMDTGIRPAEALGTREADYDLDEGSLIIREEIAKTRRRREVPLSEQTCEILKVLCSYKPEGFSSNMFCGWEGKPITTHSWYLRLREYGDKIGYRIRPYDLRHSFAIQFIKQGGSAFALRKILGHSNMNMTQVYVNLADSDMKEQQKKSSPVNNYVRRTTRIRRIGK